MAHRGKAEMSQVDFRSGLKKTGLAPTVTRADADAAALSTTSPSLAQGGKAGSAKPPDAAKSRDDDLAAKLAARRKWEEGDSGGGGGSGSLSAKVPAIKSGGGDDLAAKLAARRRWEDAADSEDSGAAATAPGPVSASEPAPAKPRAFPASQGMTVAGPKSAPGCVPEADDLAAKLAKRRNWEVGSGEGVSREEQAIAAIAKEQEAQDARVAAQAAADAEYKRKIAADVLAKRSAQDPAQEAEKPIRLAREADTVKECPDTEVAAQLHSETAALVVKPSLAKPTAPTSAPGSVPPADDLTAKLARRRNWEVDSNRDDMPQEQKASKEADDKGEQEADARAAADVEYEHNMAEKRKADNEATAAHPAEQEQHMKNMSAGSPPSQAPIASQQEAPSLPPAPAAQPYEQQVDFRAGLKKTGLAPTVTRGAEVNAGGDVLDNSPVERAKAALALSRKGKDVAQSNKKLDVRSLFEDEDDDKSSLFKKSNENSKGGNLFSVIDGDGGAGAGARSKAVALFEEGGEEEQGSVLGLDELKQLEDQQRRAHEEASKLMAQSNESKAKAALLKQRAKNSMFDDGEDEWGDTDELIAKVQTRVDTHVGTAAIKKAIESASSKHASTLEAEAAARRRADIDKKFRDRVAEEQENGTSVEKDDEVLRREEVEVDEVLRRIEEKRALQDTEQNDELTAEAPADTTTMVERPGRFSEAGKVFGYGDADVLYDKKGHRNIVPALSASAKPQPPPQPNPPVSISSVAQPVKQLTAKEKGLFATSEDQHESASNKPSKLDSLFATAAESVTPTAVKASGLFDSGFSGTAKASPSQSPPSTTSTTACSSGGLTASSLFTEADALDPLARAAADEAEAHRTVHRLCLIP